MANYITEAQYQAAVDSLGAARADAWAKQNGILVDDVAAQSQQTGEDYAEDNEELPPLAVQPGGAEQGGALAVAGKTAPSLSAKPDLEGMLGRSRQSLADLYDKAAADLQAQYQGPGTEEMLLALGSALLQPTQNGTFGESLANLPSALLPHVQGRREYRNAMAKNIGELNIAKARDLADLEAKYFTAATKGATGSGMVWSEGLRRFLPKGEAVPIESGTLNGKRTERMSDGSIRVYDAPGVFNTYDAAGNLVGGQ